MLRALFPPAEIRAQATNWGTWPGESAGPSWSGQDVSATSAMQLLTVYGCVRMISDAISTLPVDVYRETKDGKEEIPVPTWLRFPTVDLSFSEWCSQVLSSLLLHGNAYVLVTRNDQNSIVELIPLDPTAMSVRRDRGRKVFVIQGVPRPELEIVHVKGLMLPGSDVGYSPIEAARQSVGLGLAATKYGGEFFAGEGNMPGVIEVPKPAQPGQMEQIASLWRRKRLKGGRGLPGVLDDGATWKPTGVTNEQAQFLATRHYTAAEIAGQMFLLDPSDLGIAVSGSSLTYANLEQRNARRVQVTLLPWIVRIEAAISALLYNPRYMKFNVNGLLRGDTLSRYQSYAIGIDKGFLDVGEPREWEDLPPLPGQPEPPGEEPSDDPDA